MLLIPGPIPPTMPGACSPDQPLLPGVGAEDRELPFAANRGSEHRDQPGARATKLVHSFGLLVLEVWQGRRPPHQLDHAMAPHLAVAVLADSGLAAGQPRLAQVRACVVSEVAIEGSLVVAFGGRVAAVSLRLERGLNTWWCSHYHLVRAPSGANRGRPTASPDGDSSAGLGGLTVAGLELAT